MFDVALTVCGFARRSEGRLPGAADGTFVFFADGLGLLLLGAEVGPWVSLRGLGG